MSTFKSSIANAIDAISPSLRQNLGKAWNAVCYALRTALSYIKRALFAIGKALSSFFSAIAALPRTTKLFVLLLTTLFLFTLWQIFAYDFAGALFITINILLSAALTAIACFTVLSTQRYIDNSKKQIADLNEEIKVRDGEIRKLNNDLFDIRDKKNKEDKSKRLGQRFVKQLKELKTSQDPNAEPLQYVVDAMEKVFKITGAVIYQRRPDDSNLFDIAGRFALASDPPKTTVSEADGTIGQVIKDHEPQRLYDVPTVYLKALSGLGRSKTVNIYVFPIFNKEDQLVAVTEVAFFGRLSLFDIWDEVEYALKNEF